MKLKKLSALLPIIIVLLILVNACSSSSGTMRYGSNSNDKKSQDKPATRYNSKDVITTSDTSSVSDEDISEDQDPSDLPDNEAKIDITEIIKKINSQPTNTNSESTVSTKRDLILMEIIKYLDTPYKYGGSTMDGIDCSAFTQSVFKNTNLYDLNRSAREQFKQGIVIKDRSDLQFGDLVFFNTRRRVKPGHVGIYIGDNLFAHASSKTGVTISSLDYDYYSKRYMGARRLETSTSLK
jgi:cell wall-associated NlpC family hydrolase